MKQLSTFSLLLFFAFSAQAQTEKGDGLIGGELSFRAVKNSSSFTFAPSAGWFVLNNLALGANVGLDFSKTGDTKVSAFEVGPFVRFYFPGDKVRAFLRGSINYRTEKTKVAGASNNENGFSFFIGPGLSLFLNENVAFETIAGYNSINLSGRDAAGGFALRMGFQVYLNNDQMQSLRLQKKN